MTHIPSRKAMIMAVQRSGCQNLKDLPLEVMTAEEIYTHLIESKCPCLQRLLKKQSKEQSKEDIKPKEH